MGTNCKIESPIHETLSFDCENVFIKVEEPDEEPIHCQATVAEVKDDISVKVEKPSEPMLHPSMNRKTRIRRSAKMKKDDEDLVKNGFVERHSVKMEEELQLIDETDTFENLDHPQRSLRQRRPIYNMAEILKELRGSNPPKGKASRKPLTAEQKARNAENRRIQLANETPEQREERLESMRRYNRSEEQKFLHRERCKRSMLRRLTTETEEEKLIRLERRRVTRQRYYQKKKAQQASQAPEEKFEGSDGVPVTSTSGFEFMRVEEEINERTEGTESAERDGSIDRLVPMQKLYSSQRNQQFESSEDSICKEEMVIKMEEPWMIEMPESTYRLEQSGAVAAMGQVDEVENESCFESHSTSSNTSYMMYETVQNVQEYDSPDTCFIKLEKDDEFPEDELMDYHPVKMEKEPYIITERQIFQYSEDEEEETRWFDMIRLTACTAQECVAGDHCYAKVESGDERLLENGSLKRRTVKRRSRKPCPTENSNRSKRKKCLLTAEDESLAVERAMIKMAKNTPAERARRVKRSIERSEILEDYALSQRGLTQQRSRLPPTEKDVLLKSERAEWLAKRLEEQNNSQRTGACDEFVIPSHPIPTADEEDLMLQRVKMKIAERLANGLDVDRSVRVEHMRWFRGARMDKKHRRRDETHQPLATETKEEKSKRMREKKMVKREFTRLSELLQQARETEEERAIRLERQKLICSRRRERNKLANWMRYAAKSEEQKLRLRELAERNKLVSKDRRAARRKENIN